MMEYLRIGTDYYKKCNLPLLSGDSVLTLIKWSKSEIITDLGKEFLLSVPKYDGFVTIPSHQNYQQFVSNFYNQYERIEHDLKIGDFKATKVFLKHIFRDQYHLAIDYLTILWQDPLQVLPILCLVSEERKTGKTTFLNWLKLLFQNNMTINKNEDFRSRFNSDWASKLIIAVDEVLLDKREDSERIKNLSTANSYKKESKGKDKQEGGFFGKFILCSNNEENFIQIDPSEIRYWVVKVNQIEYENVDLLKQLKQEIPYFLGYLDKRRVKLPRRTRMWFTKEQIHTPALDKVIRGNKTYLDQEIKEIIVDDFTMYDSEVLCYTASDLLEKLSRSNIRTTRFKVSKCLKENYGLESYNGSYAKYFMSLDLNQKKMVCSENQKGRYFKFHKRDFSENDVAS